jgi:23S rRNA (cytidine1920-2'-O)/16S rRNA (cytidine1409-2'-O)-methyltransferase
MIVNKALQPKKERLDKLVHDLGLADSRSRAQALILSGVVYVNGQKATKSGMSYPVDAKIELQGMPIPYVSRGGLKLEAAIKAFDIKPIGWVCADIGASTGGFTDCMLQNGAAKVYAIDVGYGQLDVKLRHDPRVVVMEKVNARHLDADKIQEKMDMITIDVSFISLKIVIPAITSLIKTDGYLLALVKPQFEAGRKEIDKGEGVIRDPVIRRGILEDIRTFVVQLGYQILGDMESPVHGPSGNIEFLLWAQYIGQPSEPDKPVPDSVE